MAGSAAGPYEEQHLRTSSSTAASAPRFASTAVRAASPIAARRAGSAASDLTAAYEWSADLASWHASGASSGGTTVTFGTPTQVDAGPLETVEVTASITGTIPPKVFVRLSVSYTGP